MDRSKAEELVKGVYGARAKGDVNEVMKFTDPDIVFEILGSNERSKVAVAIKGADSFRHSLSVHLLSSLVGTSSILTEKGPRQA